MNEWIRQLTILAGVITVSYDNKPDFVALLCLIPGNVALCTLEDYPGLFFSLLKCRNKIRRFVTICLKSRCDNLSNNICERESEKEQRSRKTYYLWCISWTIIHSWVANHYTCYMENGYWNENTRSKLDHTFFSLAIPARTLVLRSAFCFLFFRSVSGTVGSFLLQLKVNNEEMTTITKR